MHGALKPGALKSLQRDGLLVLAARCARRVEHWRPLDSEALWAGAMTRLLAGAPVHPGDVSQLTSLGARATYDTDPLLGQCCNYAALTLAQALTAATLTDRQDVVKAVIVTAKYQASLFNTAPTPGLGIPSRRPRLGCGAQ